MHLCYCADTCCKDASIVFEIVAFASCEGVSVVTGSCGLSRWHVRTDRLDLTARRRRLRRAAAGGATVSQTGAGGGPVRRSLVGACRGVRGTRRRAAARGVHGSGGGTGRWGQQGAGHGQVCARSWPRKQGAAGARRISISSGRASPLPSP